MIRHIVLFKLMDTAEGRDRDENIAIARRMAETFTREIPGLKSAQIVTPVHGAPLDNEDMALICRFDDLEGLYAYKAHPAHVAFGDFMRRVRESRTSIDYEE
ncbi:MAG: Dabb family protein [Clostridiales bacterium]|nr:Dabb family protein [Clostridiales bacterium]